ncbi:MAG: HAMP domain-containing histidine kinase [Planctomycetes bacterium]|nr:HAMP domain-containing histidine kinase [Planctomycetota bacterium]
MDVAPIEVETTVAAAGCGPAGAAAAGRSTASLPRRLCAVLGHELRNPLASAVTSVAVVAEMTDRDDPRARFLARATADLERLGGLLAACLEFGRGCRPARRATTAAAVCDTLAGRLVDPRVEVRPTAVAAGLDVDPALLGRAVDNLVENALAVGAGRVVVTVVPRGAALCIEVDDDGPGVPPPLDDSLFEPFVSGRGSSGLGLAIVRDILTAHGGIATFAGSSPLGGARFRLELPLRTAAAGGLGA